MKDVSVGANIPRKRGIGSACIKEFVFRIVPLWI